MKSKKMMIDGIISCVSSIILGGFALNGIIPNLLTLCVYELYGKEKDFVILTLVMWIIAGIGAGILNTVGYNQLLNYFGENPKNKSSNYQQNALPSVNEWKCPQCGKINQNYNGSCSSCGHKKVTNGNIPK